MPSPRALLTLVGTLAAALAWSAPAGADPARPTDYRSEVLSIDGDLPAGTSIEVVGGDAFLELTIPPGHTAAVLDTATGPDGELLPYLRFLDDGTVERNASSFSAVANESRYGAGSDSFDPDAPVRWEEVASDGTYVWHDHRIHWMSTRRPPAVGDDGRVDLGGPDGTWAVPLEVDGEAVVVRGELILEEAPSPVGWLALVAVLVAGAAALGLRTSRRGRAVPYRAVAAATGGVAGAAAAAGWAQWQAIPPAAGGNALPFVVPAVAVAAAVLAGLGPARARLAALGATAAGLLGWGALRWTVLTHAVLPTTAPFAADRAATAAAIGVGLGLAALLVWHPPRRSRPGATASPTA